MYCILVKLIFVFFPYAKPIYRQYHLFSLLVLNCGGGEIGLVLWLYENNTSS